VAVTLSAGQMPQYPFANTTISDKVSYRSKGGKLWQYQNYSLDSFTFRWTMLDEAKKNTLRFMYDCLPILSFKSNGTDFGTFRITGDSWEDEEVAHELYDLSFTVEEVV
jgi:hypothetical protein